MKHTLHKDRSSGQQGWVSNKPVFAPSITMAGRKPIQEDEMESSILKEKFSAIILIGFGLSLFFYLIPHYVAQAETAALSPRFFPYLGSFIIALGGGILFLNSFRSTSNEDSLIEGSQENSRSWLKSLAVLLAMMVFVQVFEALGYLYATPPLVFSLMLVFGARSPLVLSTVPFAVTATLFLLFSIGFGVVLP